MSSVIKSVALVGLPNSGKSSLFNKITGNRQRVANFPGITVEKKSGKKEFNGKSIEVVDLPGIYTLDATTLDEKVTKDYIFNRGGTSTADTFVLVVDATNLKKSLYLALQMKEVGQNFVVALNMMDIAEKRGLEISIESLQQFLGGARVFPIVAVSGEGLDELLEEVSKESNTSNQAEIPKDYHRTIKNTEYVGLKLKEVESILKEITVKEMSKDTFTEKVDSIVLHPIWGFVTLFAVLIFMFQLLFAWADPFVGGIESLFELIQGAVESTLPDGYLKSLIIDGIIAGVGGIVVFLPHIVFLFIIINFLESFGYLGRAAFLLDFLMRKFGLPGKAVVPLLSSHACAIPGIMSARIIENRAERFITMMVSPLTSCSARLPVYALLIAVIIPDIKVWGVLGAPGLVLFGLYAMGMLSVFVISFISKKTFVSDSPSYLMMELPNYRMPKLTYVLRDAIQKGMLFLKKAGTVILLLSVIIWGLVTFPKAPENADRPAIHYSAAAYVGRTFEPIFRPLGFDWKMTTALIPSFGAREIMVSAMGTVYAVDGDDPEDSGYLVNLRDALSNEYSLATLLALLIWFVFSPQCISTFAVLKKETGGYRAPVIFGAYTLILAYGFAFLTYWLTNLFI